MNKAKIEASPSLDQEAIAWQIRRTSGGMSEIEQREFAAWRQRSPAHEQAYRQVEILWQHLPGPLLADRYSRQQAKTKRHLRRNTRRAAPLALAASLLLLIGLKFFPDYLNHPLADYRTRIGQQTSITLADGSVIHLNTDTALDVELMPNERRITLWQGEAEFEVAHDASRPFRVSGGGTSVEALGTRFVVRYDGGDSGSVALLQGKVRASRAGDNVILKPGQGLDYGRDGLGQAKAVDLATVDAWRRGRLTANFLSLGQAVAELNRYRRVPIRLMNAELAQRQVNIAVNLAQTDDWLSALNQTLPVRMARSGPWVFLF